MSTPLSISIPHQLGRAEARRRIETGFSKLVGQLPGSGGTLNQRWDGDRLTFSVSGMGQTVSGVVDVLDAAVKMDLELPGVIGLLAGGLKGRIQQAGQLLLTKK
jgi:putative polyhydroxyalkanoate system protein